MSVRQYIGARYVPIFSDPIQWDSTVSYEPLTVVMNEGTSYVSKQSVPAGIQITNETYWLRWADYNAQLEEYIRQVQTFDGRITQNAGDIDDLESALPISAFSSINTVDARFDTIEANNWVTTDRISNNAITSDKIADSGVTNSKLASESVSQAKLASSVKEEMKNRNYILLGDSYGKGLYPSGSSYEASSDGWLTFCSNIITNRTSCDVYTNLDIIQVGNHGFASSARFIDSLTSLGEIITDKWKITDIVVMAGTNDIPYVGNDLRVAITNFMNYCRDNYPNAQVTIGCLGTNISGLQNVALDYMTCRAYGGIFLADVFGLFSLVEYISSDGTHLTSDGYNFYSRYLMNAVLNRKCEYHFHKRMALTTDMLPDGYTFFAGTMLWFEIDQNGVSMGIRPQSVPGINIVLTDSSNNNNAKTVACDFTYPVKIPRFYDIITMSLTRKYNDSTLVSGKIYDLIAGGSRGAIYTTPDGMTFQFNATNAYLPFVDVAWNIEAFHHFMHWFNYQNPNA